MRVSIVAGVAVLAVAAGGWFGWDAYESSQETAAAVRAIQASALLFERQVDARKEDGVTFAEYLERSSAALKSIDNEALSLSAMKWKHRPQDRDQALAFIDECKTMTRLDAADVRLMLEESGARRAYEDAQKDLDQATSQNQEWKLERYQKKADDMLEVLRKQIAQIEEARPKVERFLATDDSVKSSFGQDKGASKTLTDAIRKRIARPEPESPAKG